jgi:hypothetical protein
MKPNSHEASGEHHGQRPVISMPKLLMRRARHFTVSAVAAFAFLAAVTARAQTAVPITLQALRFTARRHRTTRSRPWLATRRARPARRSLCQPA